MKLSKAAMFGLDARIALAIFGALSVISGAALYGAIKNAQEVAYITGLAEVEKAIEAYYIDTGVYPTGVANDYFELEKLNVEPSGVTGWNGPYINLTNGTSRYFDFKILGGSVLGVNYGKDVSWGLSRINCATMLAGQTCSLWVATQWSTKSAAESFDKRIDGSIDHNNGDVRLMCPTSGAHLGECTIYYKMDLHSNI
tara:strand:+ start:6862 stop:7455 length:594 start_codon:yes stop_codon:yes gene_type:complete